MWSDNSVDIIGTCFVLTVPAAIDEQCQTKHIFLVKGPAVKTFII